MIIPYKISAAVDPDRIPVQIQPAVFHIMDTTVGSKQITEFVGQQRIILGVYKVRCVSITL